MTHKVLVALTCLFGLVGCDPIANYDVPKDAEGDPNVASIVQRVNCELASLVNGTYPYEDLLLLFDFNVALNLSLTVNDTGSISPNFTYLDGVFTFGGGFTLSRAREQNAFRQMRISLRQLALDVRRYPHLSKCPEYDTSLSGELGIKKTVSSAIKAPGLAMDASLSPTSGAFGGIMSVVFTKAINSVGPNFTLTTFRGPSGFGNLSETNTDKLYYAFAPGPNSGKPFNRRSQESVPPGQEAERFLNQIILNDISTQLTGIRVLSRF